MTSFYSISMTSFMLYIIKLQRIIVVYSSKVKQLGIIKYQHRYRCKVLIRKSFIRTKNNINLKDEEKNVK